MPSIRGQSSSPYSAIGARRPQDILAPLVVGIAASNKKMIGKTIDVLNGRGPHFFPLRQFHHQPFGTARNRARQMKVGRKWRTSRQHKRIERGQIGIHGVDFTLQSSDLRFGDAQSAFASAALFGHRKIGAQIEQIVLDTAEHGVHFAHGMKTAKPHGRVGFVHRSVGGDAQRIFRKPGTVAKRGFALVACPGIDAIQSDHADSLTEANGARKNRIFYALARIVAAAMIRTRTTEQPMSEDIDALKLAPPEIIEVDDTRISCDGGGGTLGHPRVFLKIGEEGFVDCTYCDRRFVLRGGAKAH